MGPLPELGKWVRLEVPLSFLGLNGKQVNGVQYWMYDGRVWYDGTGNVSTTGGVAAVPASVTQSSTEGAAAAALAVDGNVDGDPANGSVALTLTEAEPWWEADLGDVDTIEWIDLYTRTDCCQGTMSDYYVHLSNVPFASTDLSTTLNDPGVTSIHVAEPQGDAKRIAIGGSGRYVRIQRNGSAQLALAEVKIAVSNRTNIAGGGTATQSSTYGSGTAEKAIDGTVGTYSHTNNNAQAWWELDLGAIESIQSVHLHNRTDCCQNRLSSYYLLASDEPFVSTDLSTVLAQTGVSAYHISGTTWTSQPFGLNRSARYLRVQLAGTNYLSLGEVDVWVRTQSASAMAPEVAEAPAWDEAELLAECASLSSEICFALAYAAKLDEVDLFTMKSDGGGGKGVGAPAPTRGGLQPSASVMSSLAATTGISTLSTDPRRYSFYSPEMSLLAETEHTTSATPPIQYEYVWFGGVPVAQLSYSVPSEPLAATEVVWTVTDHLGTPKLQTDASQQIVWHAEHEPYGQIYVLRAGEGRHQPLRFPGQEAEQLGVDSANGVSERSYNIFRWYRPGTGRYSQADPLNLGALSGGNVPAEYLLRNRDLRAQSSIRMRRPEWEHAYAYVASGPITFADPKGLFGPGDLAKIGGTCSIAWPGLGPEDAIGAGIVLVAGVWAAANWIDDILDDAKPCDECDKKKFCKKVKQACIDKCSDEELPTWPKTDQGMPFFNCVNECLEAHGCIGF